MTCEDCAVRIESMQESLDAIRVSQVQSQQSLEWVVSTVNQLMQGFQQMMSAGGPLALIKEFRKAGKNG